MISPRDGLLVRIAYSEDNGKNVSSKDTSVSKD